MASVPGLELKWHPATKILFRFLTVYFVLFVLPIPFLWRALVPWVGRHILQISNPIPLQSMGSGDSTYHYVQAFLILAGAAAGCLAWTLADRNRDHYQGLAKWLVIGCRYYLAFTMLLYGLAKISLTQFPFPPLDRLLQPLGDFSPMGLVWTFMGYSPAYNLFTGGAEALGGALLLFRRTATLGALVTAGVMSNVLMLNFSYDVPVKLFSFHLLLMATILFSLDGRRLLNLFILNRPVQAADEPPIFSSRKLQGIALASKAVLIGAVLLIVCYQVVSIRGQLYGSPKPPLWGIHDVVQFVKDGKEHPPLLTDPDRWQNLIVERWYAGVRLMNGEFKRCRFQVDEDAKTLTLTGFPEQGASRWIYSKPSEDVLIIEGEIDGSPHVIEMTFRDPNQFLLLQRGFHWINEVPFNR